MTTRSEVAHCYRQLAERVSLMAELARAKKWDRLPALEAECSSLVERLRVLKPLETLDAQQLAETRLLIERIRADQEAVRTLVLPQIEDLLERMGAMSQQQSVDRAYRVAH